MLVRHYLANGVFWHDTNTDDKKATCQNPVAKNVDVEFNHSYGLFMFGCEGGAFNESEGCGHGDSAYYVGATPFQKNPRGPSSRTSTPTRTCSATRAPTPSTSMIQDSDFYNNGVGIVPNTLDSEPSSRTDPAIIKDNNIFWNNFNYFLPNSPVKTVSGGLGGSATTSTTRPGSAWPCSAPTAGGPGQQDLRQLQVGRRRCSRTRSATRATTRSAVNNQSSTTRWAGAAPTPTPSTSSSTARAAATASRATHELDVRPEPRTRHRRGPLPDLPGPAGHPTEFRRRPAAARQPRPQFGASWRPSDADPPENQECSGPGTASEVREVQPA